MDFDEHIASTSALQCSGCRRTFERLSSLTFHQSRCSKSKKRINESLDKAKVAWVSKKKRRINASLLSQTQSFHEDELNPPTGRFEPIAASTSQPDLGSELFHEFVVAEPTANAASSSNDVRIIVVIV